MGLIKPKNEIIYAGKSEHKKRIMIGIPTTGLVRYEWVMARYGQVVPCNWSQVEMSYAYSAWSPIGFQVAEARNIIATRAVEEGFEWLLFIDHDTMPPPTMLISMNEYMLKGTIPVVSGLYFTKSVPADPLIYRDFGVGSYRDWKLGDKVWAKGCGMGCTLIHCDIFRAMKKDVPIKRIKTMTGADAVVSEYFVTPAECRQNELGQWMSLSGTEDLYWCKLVAEGGYITKAGWPKVGKKEHQFLIDTNIFCRHISNDGVMYPSRGEDNEFILMKK